ncbi:putative endothiapepsin [Amylocarpus encephaloides]|uniref:Endothiapepsin n=1 Tax=Amylocarpus encephaloides TaxID=45428 RepID=A0A9P8C5E4_9HELO|nr:putative endothiapepsin [Amylocarpus encephaloides]
MHSAVGLLALATAAVQAAPAPVQPVPELVGSSQFSAPAVKNPSYTRNGTAALLKAYAKHSLVPTQEFSPAFMAELSSLKKRQDGSAPAMPYEGVEYLVSTTVGGQKLNLDFDTGSADLWVFSSGLSAASKKGHNVYNSASSSTYKALSGYTWSIQYADGSGASGTVGTDTVTIGGTSVKAQAVELATKVSSQFVSDGSDGLVGLAFSNINTVRPRSQKTFFDNANPSLASPLFAAYLPFNANGAYDFGYVDASKYTGSVSYAAVSSSGGFWEYASTSYKVGSTAHAMSGTTGIADTGTTLLLMVDSAVSAYYASVSGAKNTADGWTFPCAATLPSLAIRMGSSAYATIPGSLLNFETYSGSTCYGALQSVGGGTQNIYGDVFFNAYYGIFDSTGPRFGFAAIN